MTKARDLANIISGGFTADDIPNLDAAKITSGTFADARIAASNVSQHAQSFDDNKLVNDISTLALRQASNENKAAYNTNSMYVDVFQDSTGITGLTNAVRSSDEYLFSASQATDSTVKFMITGNGSGQTITDATSNHTITVNGNTTWSTAQKKFGTSSIYFDGSGDYLSIPDSNDWYYGQSGNGWTFETWFLSSATTEGFLLQQGINSSNGNPRK